MTRGLIFLSSVLFLPNLCSGFISPWIQGVAVGSPPELDRYARGQTETTLDVRLNIGLEKNAPQFVIDGFQFRLRCDRKFSSKNATSDDAEINQHRHIPLPGADGPRSHLSSGAYSLRVVKDGTFVNMEGLQTVELRDGCWEMIWRDGAAAGLVICALYLAEDASRSGSTLQKGNIYISFPVWAKEGLQKLQSLKLKVQARYNEFELERNSQLEKMSNTPNILMKALHYRNAVVATSNMDNTGLHLLIEVPSDDDVMEIGEGLQLVRTGTVWTKNGPVGLKNQKLLGSATLC